MATTANQTSTETTPKAKAKVKSKSPAPVIPVLTKPEGKSSKSDKLPVVGHEKQAAKIRSLVQEIESAEAEKSVLCSDLIAVCAEKRLTAEKAGDFHKTCEVASEDNDPVLVIFADKYSKVDVVHEDVLKKALGDSYGVLVRRGVEVKAKPETTLAALKEALGGKFDALAALVDLTEYLVPGKGYMEKRATLRPTLDDATNTVIDGITAQVQQKPSVKTK